jgi:hypothetical protein
MSKTVCIGTMAADQRTLFVAFNSEPWLKQLAEEASPGQSNPKLRYAAALN